MINIPFKNSILSWSIKKRIHQIDLFIKYPNDVQHDVFVNLISNGKHSKFGEEHNFKSINSYLDFCKHIPIRTYEELFPYVERLRRGEKNVLWPGKVKWFAKSSGTTDNKIYVLNSKNGKTLWEFEMEYAGSSPAMTYLYKGNQYIIINSSGGQYYGYDNQVYGDLTYAFKLN